MDDDNGLPGRARLRFGEEDRNRRQYHWLLLIPLLALGYGGYAQRDFLRGLFTPDPVPETPPLPPATPVSAAPVPMPTPTKSAPMPEPAIEVPPLPRASTASPVQTDSLPSLPTLFPVVDEPVRTRAQGKAGLVEALRERQLRIANPGDVARWKSSHARAAGKSVDDAFDEYIRHMDVYVVQGDFEIPAGLHGAHAVVFLVDPHAPFPRGDAGHSPILDIDSGACIGPTCSMLAGR